MSFARGMFNKAAAGHGGTGGARRPRPDTLCQLRWHQPLPTDGDTARAVSAAICDKVAGAPAAAQRRRDAASSRSAGAASAAAPVGPRVRGGAARRGGVHAHTDGRARSAALRGRQGTQAEKAADLWPCALTPRRYRRGCGCATCAGVAPTHAPCCCCTTWATALACCPGWPEGARCSRVRTSRAMALRRAPPAQPRQPRLLRVRFGLARPRRQHALCGGALRHRFAG